MFCLVKRKWRLKPAKFFCIAHCDLDVLELMGLSVQRQRQRRTLSLPATLPWEDCVLTPPMAGWHLDCTNIKASIHDARKTRAALIHSQRWTTRVDCRAIRCRQMREGGPPLFCNGPSFGSVLIPSSGGR